MKLLGERMRLIRRVYGARGDRTSSAAWARELGVSRFTVRGWETKRAAISGGIDFLEKCFERVVKIRARQLARPLAVFAITGIGDLQSLGLAQQPETRDPEAAPVLAQVDAHLSGDRLTEAQLNEIAADPGLALLVGAILDQIRSGAITSTEGAKRIMRSVWNHADKVEERLGIPSLPRGAKLKKFVLRSIEHNVIEADEGLTALATLKKVGLIAVVAVALIIGSASSSEAGQEFSKLARSTAPAPLQNDDEELVGAPVIPDDEDRKKRRKPARLKARRVNQKRPRAAIINLGDARTALPWPSAAIATRTSGTRAAA